MTKPGVPFKPEMLWNYSPVIKPAEPLAIMDICEGDKMCLQVSCAFIPYLLGLLEVYRYPFTFKGTDEEKERSAGLFRDLMEEIAMSCCDCTPGSELAVTVQVRVTVDGHIQISIDGGETWTPHPNSPEVRAPQIPPTVTGDISYDKCNAASNVIEHLQEIKERVADEQENLHTWLEYIVDIAALILSAILIYFGQVELLPLIGGIATWAKRWHGVAVEEWNAVWTQEVWDKMLCILLCHISDGAVYTEQAYQAVVSDISTKIPGGAGAKTAGESLVIWLQLWQMPGLNTAAHYGSGATLDCSDCECNPCERTWDFTQSFIYSGVSYQWGTKRNGEGLEVNSPQPPDNDFYAKLTIIFDEPCTARYFQVSTFAPANIMRVYLEIATEIIEGVYNWTAAGNGDTGIGESGFNGVFTPDENPVPRLAMRVTVWDHGFQLGGDMVRKVILQDDPF